MPVDPKTGKEYPYTEEGIEQHKKDTGGMPYAPFKMKGISPVKDKRIPREGNQAVLQNRDYPSPEHTARHKERDPKKKK